jgi:hypothetical protein
MTSENIQVLQLVGFYFDYSTDCVKKNNSITKVIKTLYYNYEILYSKIHFSFMFKKLRYEDYFT